MIDDKQRRPSGAPSGQLCLGGREYRLGPAAERGAVTAWPAAEAGGGVWDDVLIRRLRPGAGERQVRLFRLAWEAEAEQLDLPGARSLFFEQPESGCILRSFPKAPSLAALFEQRPGPLPAEEALELTARLLRALEGFHSRGLLHLDIRAEQIYLLPGRRLFLDNCRALDMERPEENGLPRALGPCAAPELRLMNLAALDRASDIFSCCALLYRMLLGRPLTGAELMGTGLARGLRQSLARAQELPDARADELARLLWRGLHLLPQRRFSSARELLGLVSGLRGGIEADA